MKKLMLGLVSAVIVFSSHSAVAAFDSEKCCACVKRVMGRKDTKPCMDKKLKEAWPTHAPGCRSVCS